MYRMGFPSMMRPRERCWAARSPLARRDSCAGADAADERGLGIVKGLRSSAAHDLLEVEPGVLEPHRPGRDMLIPVVGEYIDGIEVDAGVVRVNWEPEWLE